jgi:hypothetical protein
MSRGKLHYNPYRMLRKSKASFIFLVFISASWLSLYANAAQNEPKPLSPNDLRLGPHLLRMKDRIFYWKLRLDETGAILAVDIYREGGSRLQGLPICTSHPDRVTENWTDFQIATLVTTPDLNFDGYDDLQLAQGYSPYINKLSYCIFLWDSKSGKFRYASDLSVIATGTVIGVNPASKTLHTYTDLPESRWEDSTYRWNEGKLELIQQSGLYGDWFGPEAEKGPYCRAVYFSCKRRITGKLVVTLKKWICSPNEETLRPPDCPAYQDYR